MQPTYLSLLSLPRQPSEEDGPPGLVAQHQPSRASSSLSQQQPLPPTGITPPRPPPLATSSTWEPRRHDASSTSPPATGAAPSFPIPKLKFEEPLTPHRRHCHLPHRTASLPPSSPYKRHPRAPSPHHLPIPRIGSLHPRSYCPLIELCHRPSVPHCRRLTSGSPAPRAALGENHVAPLTLCPSSQRAPVDWSGRTAQVRRASPPTARASPWWTHGPALLPWSTGPWTRLTPFSFKK
jgi:hypothetical protein